MKRIPTIFLLVLSFDAVVFAARQTHRARASGQDFTLERFSRAVFQSQNALLFLAEIQRVEGADFLHPAHAV